MPQPDRPPANAGLFALLLLCVRQRRLIAAITFAGTLLALVLALTTPHWYTAGAELLPSRGGAASKLASMLGPASGVLPIDPFGGNEGGLLVGLLESRTVTDATITKHGLLRVYRVRTMEDARHALATHAKIALDRKSGIVTITVEDRDPKLARDIANSLADEANRLNNELEAGRAGQERRFLEKRLEEVQGDLAKAEVALRDFQSKHGVLDIGEQTRATVRAVASLRAELMAREVQMSYLASFAGGDEQNTVRARREIAELKRQIGKMEFAPPTDAGASKSDGRQVMLPAGELPPLTLEYVRLMRALKIQEAVFELLTKQYELAKVGEVRDTNNAQVIDHAVLPTKRSWPVYSVMLALGFFASFFLSLGLAWAREGIQRDPDLRRRWRELWPWSKPPEHPDQPSA